RNHFRKLIINHPIVKLYGDVCFTKPKRLCVTEMELELPQCFVHALYFTNPGKIQGCKKRVICLPPPMQISGSHIAVCREIFNKFLKRHAQVAIITRGSTLDVKINPFKARLTYSDLVAPTGYQPIIRVSHDGHSKEIRRLQNVLLC